MKVISNLSDTDYSATFIEIADIEEDENGS
jgi:hypothetical protein